LCYDGVGGYWIGLRKRGQGRNGGKGGRPWLAKPWFGRAQGKGGRGVGSIFGAFGRNCLQRGKGRKKRDPGKGRFDKVGGSEEVGKFEVSPLEELFKGKEGRKPKGFFLGWAL